MLLSVLNSRHHITATDLGHSGNLYYIRFIYFWWIYSESCDYSVLTLFYILDETAASRVVCYEACLHWHRGGHDWMSKSCQTWAFPQFLSFIYSLLGQKHTPLGASDGHDQKFNLLSYWHDSTSKHQSCAFPQFLSFCYFHSLGQQCISDGLMHL